ncbi:MAG: DNA primase [Candidatus Omnitrophica bacterium]|nr:DNA primase [Candidatus Omnitrophota bacterium]
MGLIPNEIINAVLDRSDIAAVIGRYAQLKKAGRNLKALCPFHQEKSPSFVVNPDKQIFHCFGCGAGGDAVGFIMRQERLEFPQAVRFLAQQCGVAVPEHGNAGAESPSRKLREDIYKVNELAAGYFHGNLLTGRDAPVHAARDYLKNRGVSLETVRRFQLGFAADAWEGLIGFLKQKGISEGLMEQAGLVIAREHKRGFYDRFRNRIVFPIFDIQARPVAFGARALSNEEGAKYINSPETPVYTKGRHLFGFHLTKGASGKLDQVIVVEGYMDMIMPFVHGVEHIAASLGTALTVDQIRLIRRYTSNVVMLFDTDPAGQNAIIRSLDLLVEEGMNVRVVTLSAGEDPDSFIRAHGAQAFHDRLSKAASLFDFKLAWLKDRHDAGAIEGKAEVCQRMLETIARFDNAIIRSELVKKLREDLQIDEIAVLQQLNALKSPKAGGQAVKAAAKAGLSLNDEIFLGILLSGHQWVIKAREELVPQDFSHPLMRDMVEGIWQLSKEKQEWTVRDLFARLGDQAAQDIITGLLSRDEAWLGDKQAVFRDCLSKLRVKRLEKQKEFEKRSGNLQAVEGIIKQIKGIKA